MSISPGPGRWLAWFPLAIIVVAALLVRVAFAPAYAYLPGGYLDERFWTVGMRTIHAYGFLDVFRPHADARLPQNPNIGYQWVLWLLSLIYGWLGGAYHDGDAKLHLLVKAPAIAADLILIAVAYYATAALADSSPDPRSSPADAGVSRRGRRKRLALTGAAVIAFQPAVVYDSAVWAQTDALTSVAMLSSALLVARGRPTAGWAVWALGFSVKPLPVAILPVLASYTVLLYGGRGLARGGAAAIAVMAAVVTPWVLHGDAVRISQAFGSMIGSDYGRLSVSAWNTWWFADRLIAAKPEDAVIAAVPFVTYRLLGLLLTMAAATIAAGYTSVHRDLRGLLTAGAYMAFAFYMLPMSVHERYLFPVLALLLPVALVDRRWMWIYAPASLTLFVNMFVIAPSVHAWAGRWVEAPIIPFAAGTNVAIFLAFSVVIARDARHSLPGVFGFVRQSYPFSLIGRQAMPPAEPPAARAA